MIDFDVLKANKKIVALLLAAALFLFRGSVYKLYCSISIGVAGNELSQEQVSNYLLKIAKTYRTSGTIYVNEINLNDPDQHQYLGTDEELFSDVTEDKLYFLLASSYSVKGDEYPMEVYGVFYCHLFLKERVVSADIAAISWRYSSGGWNNSRYQRTTITPEVFEDLYNRCNVEGMSMRKAARVLGDQWMLETGYVKLK